RDPGDHRRSRTETHRARPALSRPDDRLCENESMPVWIVIGVAAAIFVLVFVVAATFNVFSAETVYEAEEGWTAQPDGCTGAYLETETSRPALRGNRMEDVDQAMQILRERLDELESAADVEPTESANYLAESANDPAGAASDAASEA